MAWVQYAVRHGYECSRTVSQYFNGGFIGIRREYKSALGVWKRLQDGLGEIGVNTAGFQVGNRTQPFYGSDQDVLNLMAMITEHPLSTIGPEGMDFVPGGFTMAHAVGSPKPWRKPMLLSALKGVAPTSADKHFWQNTQSPIQLCSTKMLFRKQIDLRCGSAVGRILRRS